VQHVIGWVVLRYAFLGAAPYFTFANVKGIVERLLEVLVNGKPRKQIRSCRPNNPSRQEQANLLARYNLVGASFEWLILNTKKHREATQSTKPELFIKTKSQVEAKELK
jgi:hypothetical protein